MTELSIVAPVYNSEGCLRELHRRLTVVLEELVSSHEIVLVEDRGSDGSWALIRELAAEDPRVRGLRLSRNFGQHIAITAGMEAARGERVLVMDCDLQDPPEEIPRLWAAMDEGVDIVFARRRKRKDGVWKRITGGVFYRIYNLLSDNPAEGDLGTFSLLTRQVVDEFLRVPDVHRHYLFVIRWLGFRRGYIDVEHAVRHAGRSGYSFTKLVRHAVDGIASQSTRLLYASTFMGFAFGGLAALQMIYIAYRKLFTEVGVEGWASLMAVVWFVGGSILVSLGVIGLYLGKLFEQARGRPLYVIGERTEEQAR